MDIKDLRSLSLDALKDELKQALTKLQEYRFSLSANQMKDVRDVRELKRHVARINTVQKEKSEK